MNILEQVKTRLRQYTVSSDGTVTFTQAEENPYIEQLIGENIDYFVLYRHYPASMSTTAIEDDIDKHSKKIVALVLYDYNKEGVEFETSNTENGYTRHYSDKGSILADVIPFANIV